MGGWHGPVGSVAFHDAQPPKFSAAQQIVFACFGLFSSGFYMVLQCFVVFYSLGDTGFVGKELIVSGLFGWLVCFGWFSKNVCLLVGLGWVG